MNILIVDDEELIRRWLGMLLDRLPEYDCQTFFAENGVQALDFCGKEKIDLVITDIRMPRCSGLELLEQVHAQYLHIPVAVLSAYDDFEYVRTALQNGALDYIPKAEMSLEDIARVLKKAQKSASASQWDHIDFRRATAQVRELSQKFQAFLDSDQMDDAFLEETCPALVLDRLCLALLTLERRTTDPSRRRAEIVALAEQQMKRQGMMGIAIWLPETERYCLLYQAPISAERDIFYRFFDALDPVLEQEVGRVVWCSIHLRCPRGIRAAYQKAQQLMEQKIYYGKQAEEMPPGEIQEERPFYQTLQEHLECGQYTQAITCLRQAVSAWHMQRMAPSVLQSRLRTAHSILAAPFADNTQPQAWEDLRALGSAIDTLQTQVQTERWFTELDKQYERCCTGRRKVYSPPIAQSLEYIQQHFQEHISLKQLSGLVHLNQNYFSGLFKREVGVNYHEYVEGLRIRQARKLIRSGQYTMAEIAGMTGFPTQHAFTKTFRRIMGQSPMEFKKETS